MAFLIVKAGKSNRNVSKQQSEANSKHKTKEINKIIRLRFISAAFSPNKLEKFPVHFIDSNIF